MKVLALCAIALPALASANDVGHWYVTPQIGGIRVDNDRPVEDEDWLYGLSIGKHVNSGLNLEINLNGTQLDGRGGGSDLSLYGGSFDLLGVLHRSSRFTPYLSVGLGAAENARTPGENATDFMTQAGVGAFIRLWEKSDGSGSLALRPDFKARWNDAGASGTLVDYIGTLGLQYSFGAPEARPVAATPPPPPPPAEPAPAVPATPPPPADSDRDGVTDDRDRCPGTPAGVAVDEFGCPRTGSITLEGVTFELNSARLTADSRGILDGVARDLAKYPQLRIELQGHTDSSGSDQYNLTLSQQRADAVREHLVGAGVATTQLAARGYGEGQPVADNTTSDGRAKNRRVVMFVLANPGDVKVQGEGAVEP